MADRKWNNQGGSSRDGGRKNKIDKPSDPFDIPSFEDLKESEVTSFRLVKQRHQQANYGQFGDAVWVPDVIIDDDLIRDLEDPYRFPDLSTDRIDEIKPFSESDNIKKIPLPNPVEDLATIGRSVDLLPHSAKDEYELIVKFRKVILTILSGQAYAARNQLNDKKYDSSIVIVSDNPISMSGGASAVNIIQLVNGVQDPIDSLYDWMMTKTKIVTDGTGKNTDVKLLSIRRQQAGKRLPETSFTYAGEQYGLFYVSSGIQPYQICMHARNDVVKFVAGNPKDDKYWSVLNANPPLALCIANIPTVSIALAPGSASELEAGGGMSFVLRVTVDPIQSGDTLVEYEILGTANSNFYTATGTSFDSDGVPVVNIPNGGFKDIFIEPLDNASETENKTIIFKLKESDKDRYLLDVEFVELTIKPKPPSSLPVVSFGVCTLQNTPAGSSTIRLTLDKPLSTTRFAIVSYSETIDTVNLSNGSVGTTTFNRSFFVQIGSVATTNTTSYPGIRVTRLRALMVSVSLLVPTTLLTENVDYSFGIKSIDITPTP